jgi:hypothetical protein
LVAADLVTMWVFFGGCGVSWHDPLLSGGGWMLELGDRCLLLRRQFWWWFVATVTIVLVVIRYSNDSSGGVVLLRRRF